MAYDAMPAETVEAPAAAVEESPFLQALRASLAANPDQPRFLEPQPPYTGPRYAGVLGLDGVRRPLGVCGPVLGEADQ